MIPLSYYVVVSTVMFVIGLIGVLIRKNFLIILYAIELMLNAANINLVAFSRYFESVNGQVISLFIITIAAAEAAVGLAIIIVLFRKKATTNVDEISLLKW
jgi:NADH-quinone oxidoreductase subunit K